MMNRLKVFKTSQRGDVAIALAIALSVYVLVTIISFVVNFAMLADYKGNLNYAAKEMMGVMRESSGADMYTEQRFRDLVRKMGYNPDRITFTATPKPVQREGELEITYRSTYPIWAFKLVGVPEYNMEVKNTIPGVARKLIR